MYIHSLGKIWDIPDLSPSSAAIIYHLTSHLIQAGFKMATAFPLGKFHYCSRDRDEDVMVVLVLQSTIYNRQCSGLSMFAGIQYSEAPDVYE